jgi:hypothetical protein
MIGAAEAMSSGMIDRIATIDEVIQRLSPAKKRKAAALKAQLAHRKISATR